MVLRSVSAGVLPDQQPESGVSETVPRYLTFFIDFPSSSSLLSR